MGKFKYYTPDGVSDILPDECKKKRDIERRLRDLFSLSGIREIETPDYEFYDVFAAGDGLAPQEGLFKFVDSNGRILALRYDGTVPVARVASTVLKEQSAPLKLFYIGNMYRFNEIGGGKQKSFTQAGVEVLGSRTLEADFEVISLAIEASLAAGLVDFQISIGEVEFFKGLAQEWGLNNEETDELRKIVDTKEIVALKSFCLRMKLPELAESVLGSIMMSYEGEDVLTKLDEVVKNEKSKKALKNLRDLLELLCMRGYGKYVSADLGILQSLDYYTGIIFKGFTYGIGFAFLSGGRYDNVVGVFGKEMPATGFSMGVNMVLSALNRQGRGGNSENKGIFVGYDKTMKACESVSLFVKEQRARGVVVSEDCMGLDMDELAVSGKMQGFERVVFVKSNGEIVEL